MKRDCGQGELIPIKWEVVYSPPFSDEEREQQFSSLPEASGHFDCIASVLELGANVRLYAKDKQGYENCIKSVFNRKGVKEVQDRTKELGL